MALNYGRERAIPPHVRRRPSEMWGSRVVRPAASPVGITAAPAYGDLPVPPRAQKPVYGTMPVPPRTGKSTYGIPENTTTVRVGKR